MVIKRIDNIKLYFDPKIDSGSEIVERVLLAYKKNTQFFKQSLLNEYEIHIIYNREEIDRVCGMKTESWLVGTTTKDSVIYIFSPRIFDKVSSHPLSNFEPVLTHELAHIFLNEFYKFYQPVWLNEGVAGYIAEQYKNKLPKRISDFEKLHRKEDWNTAPNYAQSSRFVSFLVEVFGKGKFFQFLKIISLDKKAQDGVTTFSKVFSDYFNKSFEQVVGEWQKKDATPISEGVASQ